MLKVIPHSFLFLQLPANMSHRRMWPQPCGAHYTHKATVCYVYLVFQEEKEAFLFSVTTQAQSCLYKTLWGQRWCQFVTFNITMGPQIILNRFKVQHLFIILQHMQVVVWWSMKGIKTQQRSKGTHVHDNKKSLQLQPRPTAILWPSTILSHSVKGCISKWLEPSASLYHEL